ncbi:MAG: iron uptake porin [Heteroscytonema crispum UTEX LB 1556]
MELSLKRCLWQRICSKKLLAGSLIFFGIFSSICLPSKANSLPSVEQLNIKATIPEGDGCGVWGDGCGVWGDEGDEGRRVWETRGQGEKNNLLPPISPSRHLAISPSPHLPISPSPNSPIAEATEPDNVDVNSEVITPLTSVEELSDVKPTDWAYQALQSLMEKYGVISGYPDATFRGNRTVSRYEFAASLAATIEKVESLIASAIGDQYIQQDIITLRRLQREYRSALDDLRQRVDQTSERATLLEARQFSTTTKLQGQLIFANSGGSKANNTLITRERLNLNTSFSPKDLLVTQLEYGNNGGDAISLAHNQETNLLGTSGLIADGGGLDYTEVDSNLKLRRLYYTFRPIPDLAVTVGAKMSPRDFIDRNRYANNEAVDFSSSFFINNPLIVQNQIDREGGAGAAIAWNPKGSKLSVRSLYIASAANQANSTTDAGLFGGPHQASVELEYLPSNKLAVRLQYTNAEINNTHINAFGVNAEYSLNRNTGVFGRLGFGNYQGFNTAIQRDLDLHPLSWAVGVGLRNFVIPGTVAGIAIGQPFVTKDLGNTTQTNFEAFYNLELSDNISVTPILSLINKPNNDSSQGTIWQTTLRTVFSF